MQAFMHCLHCVDMHQSICFQFISILRTVIGIANFKEGNLHSVQVKNRQVESTK